MIGLDTNVLVRYLTQDDAQQAAIATRLIDHDLSSRRPGFISLVVLVEMCWVLKRLYSATEKELNDTVSDLLQARQFQVEHHEVVQAATLRMAACPVTTGFVDTLIVEINKSAGCSHTVSFDKGAVKSAGMVALV